jgi:hypothetical protein
VRGGRLERVKPISPLLTLCRAAADLACASVVKAHERRAPERATAERGNPLRRVKPMRVAVLGTV